MTKFNIVLAASLLAFGSVSAASAAGLEKTTGRQVPDRKNAPPMDGCKRIVTKEGIKDICDRPLTPVVEVPSVPPVVQMPRMTRTYSLLNVGYGFGDTTFNGIKVPADQVEITGGFGLVHGWFKGEVRGGVNIPVDGKHTSKGPWKDVGLCGGCSQTGTAVADYRNDLNVKKELGGHIEGRIYTPEFESLNFSAFGGTFEPFAFAGIGYEFGGLSMQGSQTVRLKQTGETLAYQQTKKTSVDTSGAYYRLGAGVLLNKDWAVTVDYKDRFDDKQISVSELGSTVKMGPTVTVGATRNFNSDGLFGFLGN